MCLCVRARVCRRSPEESGEAAASDAAAAQQADQLLLTHTAQQVLQIRLAGHCGTGEYSVRAARASIQSGRSQTQV